MVTFIRNVLSKLSEGEYREVGFNVIYSSEFDK